MAAGILAAAVITGVVFLIARPWAPQPRYDVWSGNAVIEMTFDSSSILGPAPSRAVMLAADIAMARDALASLKRA